MTGHVTTAALRRATSRSGSVHGRATSRHDVAHRDSYAAAAPLVPQIPEETALDAAGLTAARLRDTQFSRAARCAMSRFCRAERTNGYTVRGTCTAGTYATHSAHSAPGTRLTPVLGRRSRVLDWRLSSRTRDRLVTDDDAQCVSLPDYLARARASSSSRSLRVTDYVICFVAAT
jgi:hypothetical protein